MRTQFGSRHGMRRRGFSLIELLIVVAIIAALVGVAVPFFQDNLSEAQRTKASQDLEVIKKAISLYDARESRPLTGTALDPLLGRYMQELPKDPWGNPYLFDGAAGFLASYGADSLPDGSGGDTDITVYTKAPLMINRVQYQGSWGRPAVIPSAPPTYAKGNRMIITLTKPTNVVGGAGADYSPGIMLVRSPGQPLGGAANEIQTNNATLGAGAQVWSAPTGALIGDPLHKPELGTIILHCIADMTTVSAAQAITPTMSLDFADTGSGNVDFLANPDPVSVSTVLIESTYVLADPRSPLDPNAYGTAVDPLNPARLYHRPPQAVELVNATRRGVKMEKY